MKLSIGVFGTGEWAIRLPNTFGHFLFIFFSIRIVKATLSWTYLGLFAIVLLNFNPYFLDFFSVARGYGLAMGMMMTSMYFFLHHLKNRHWKYWVISLFFAFLAVWSNFIHLLYFVTLVGIYGIIELERYLRSKQDLKTLTKGQAISLIGTLGLAAIVAVPVHKLNEMKEFKYGGSSSFYKDTYATLLEYSLYANKYFGEGTLQFLLNLVLVLLVSSSLLIIFHHLKSKQLISENKGLIFLLFGLVLALISIIQHHLLGAAYLTVRRSIIFLPFAALVVSLGLKELEYYSKTITSFLAILIMLFSLYHFVENTKYYKSIKEWYFDQDTREVLNIIQAEVEDMNKSPVKVEVDFLMKNGINFYQKTQNLDWIEPMQWRVNQVAGDGYDFYYIFENDRSVITDQVDTLFSRQTSDVIEEPVYKIKELIFTHY